jgi:5-methylcytosine-specific restriction protein B
VLVIDEINRGSLPKLLGELVYALEYRDHPVTLPFTDEEGSSELVIPSNLYIVATMNSSDRSIGHMDVAIRRRFGLCHVGPNPDVVRSVWGKEFDDSDHGNRLASLMDRLNTVLHKQGEVGTDVDAGVGHSYFLPTMDSTVDNDVDPYQQVENKWRYQVQPLLREYAQLLNLGTDFFQRFAPDLEDALKQS